jgi:hypothetical protein
MKFSRKCNPEELAKPWTENPERERERERETERV